MSDPADPLDAQAGALGVRLEPTGVTRMLAFEELLLHRAIPMGAVARSDAARIRPRHTLDCLRAVPAVAAASSACDLGSGAGLPGLVVAIALPMLEMTLLEPRAGRAAFLELAVRELGLANVEVVISRAEDARLEVDACLARAFAPLTSSWEAAADLLRPGGRLVYFAGAGAAAEDLAPPSGARLVAVTRTPVLESSGPLVIMARQ